MNLISTTSERLKEILEERNITQTKLANLAGIPKTTMSDYCSGKFEPKSNNLMVIARVLNIEPLWLMGYDVPKTSNNGLKQEIIGQLEKMNEKQLLKVQKMIELMIEED